MELKLKINYQQLMAAINELSLKDFLKLKKDLSQMPEPPSANRQNLKELLKGGPILSDEKYEEFLENRKRFSEWRTA